MCIRDRESPAEPSGSKTQRTFSSEEVGAAKAEAVKSDAANAEIASLGVVSFEAESRAFFMSVICLFL